MVYGDSDDNNVRPVTMANGFGKVKFGTGVSRQGI